MILEPHLNKDNDCTDAPVQKIIKESLLLQAVESEDIQDADKVEIKAFILANGRQDTLMEKVVGLLSLERDSQCRKLGAHSPAVR